MSITPNVKHTWTTSIKNDSGSAVVSDPPLVLTADAEENFAVQIPPGETAEVDIAITVDDIVSAFIAADHDVAVSTNAADHSGGQLINVPANQSVSWHNQMKTTNPFTPDITKLFIHNAGTAIAKVRGGFLLQE